MENNVDMEELATSATAEVTETKPAKDRKSRKEKNKPFEKVINHKAEFRLAIFLFQFLFYIDCRSPLTTFNDRRRILKTNRSSSPT